MNRLVEDLIQAVQQPQDPTPTDPFTQAGGAQALLLQGLARPLQPQRDLLALAILEPGPEFETRNWSR